MTIRSDLTPQMLAYQEKFNDAGDIRWLPYVMYFHPVSHVSATVNTDAKGFRYTESEHTPRFSVADLGDVSSVRLLAGSSTVFGIGASADSATMPSRMTALDARAEPWLNFGGRSFNSAQELLLFVLYRHLLPPVKEIVLFSGFNNLGLARLPERQRGDHGSFYNSGYFNHAMSTHPQSLIRRMTNARKNARNGTSVSRAPTMDEQIAYATDLTLRHLDVWHALASDMGARLTYVLQPLAGWIRPEGSPEEVALFEELDQLGRFGEVFGDIANPAVGQDYAQRLGMGAADRGIHFVDMSPIIAESVAPDQWLFVDRVHFNDAGYDLVASLLLSELLRAE